jgi:beta-lactamase regulating signal transducer with metallopeptidase domain
MTIISDILSSDCAHRLGWVLIHSVWQDTLVALALALVLAALRDRSANLRYLTAYAGLVLMLVMPMATYFVVSEPANLGPQGSEVLRGNVMARPGNAGTSLDDIAAASGRLGNPDSDRYYQDLPVPTWLPWEAPAETIAQSSRWLQEILSPCMPWLTTAWFVGAFSLSLWHLGGWFTAQRLKHSGISGEIERLRRHLGSLSRRMKVARPVQLLQSAAVEVPVVVGWLRPVILLPATMLTGLPPSQLTAVLAHELAHVRRHDYLFNLLQTVIETLLFYHPAAWWTSRRIRIEREHSCDDLAVTVCVNRIEYAAVLAAIEQARSAPALALAAGGRRRDSLTLRRVRRILDRSRADHTGSRVWLGGALTIVLVASFGTAVALSLVTAPIKADRQQVVSEDGLKGPHTVEGVSRRPKPNPLRSTSQQPVGRARNGGAASLPEVLLPSATLMGRLMPGENTADYVKGKAITPAENTEPSPDVPFYEGETEMKRFLQSVAMATAATGFAAGFATGSAEAQMAGPGGFGMSGGGGGASYLPGGAPDSLLRMIGYEEVREDLELEEENAGRIEELISEFRDFKTEVLSRPREPDTENSPDETIKRMAQLQRICDKISKQIESLLTADQLRRLEQIALQVQGAKVLFKPEIAKALEITPAQKKQLTAIRQQAKQESHALMMQTHFGAAEDRHQTVQAAVQKTLKIREKAEQRMLAEVLDTRQKAKLQELQGKKLDLAVYYESSTGGGGISVSSSGRDASGRSFGTRSGAFGSGRSSKGNSYGRGGARRIRGGSSGGSSGASGGASGGGQIGDGGRRR